MDTHTATIAEKEEVTTVGTETQDTESEPGSESPWRSPKWTDDNALTKTPIDGDGNPIPEPVTDPYPMHTKLKKINDHSQEIYDFLEWIKAEYDGQLMMYAVDSETVVCPDDELHKSTPEKCHNCKGRDTYKRKTFEGWTHVPKPIKQLLADYYEIDLNILEAEKTHMLDELRTMNASR